MSTRPRGAVGALAVVGALAALAVAAPASAQDRGTPRTLRSDCRCVDSAGKEIPDCTCFRAPDMSNLRNLMVWRMAGSRTARARLGITIANDQSPEDDATGVRVEGVMADGPAAKAGLKEGDVITRVDGQTLTRPMDKDTEEDLDPDASAPVQRLMALIRDMDPDQDVSVEYMRDGAQHTAIVKTQDLDDWARLREFQGVPSRVEGLRVLPEGGGVYRIGSGERMRAWECPGDSGARHDFLMMSDQCIGGLEMVRLNPKLADYFGTSEGVLVADVTDDSTLGLQPGDIILAVGDREVKDADHVRRILRSYGPDEDITFRIMRQKKEMSVRGSLGR
ncbi:MAG: PDZ domain-containing protein [Gemmatimonadota bacterium]